MSQREWFAPRAIPSVAARRATLARLARALVDARNEIAEALHADFGKPAAEVELTEIQPVLREIRHTRRHVARWARASRVPTPALLFGTRSEIRREPKGVVLIIAPWNYPVYLSLMPLVSALAAGNSVVLKPSEKVPCTGAALARLIAKACDPADAVVVQGDGALAAELVGLPFDHIFFTGSARTGRKVLAAAAAQLTPVTLELGGKSPAIIDETADVRHAAERIMWGKFLNAGQTCVAPDYVWVHGSQHDAFVAEAKRVLAGFGAAPSDYCRIVDQEAWDRLERLRDEAVRRGARVETSGAHPDTPRHMAPTLITHASVDMAVMQEEIFGPLLPILPFRDSAQVTAFLASGRKPLALYVFSRDRERVEQWLRDTHSGGAVVNHVVLHLGNPNLPFGGVGASGMGNYHGQFGFTTFSHQRAVLRAGRPDLVRAFYPPYGPKVRRALAFVDRWLS